MTTYYNPQTGEITTCEPTDQTEHGFHHNGEWIGWWLVVNDQGKWVVDFYRNGDHVFSNHYQTSEEMHIACLCWKGRETSSGDANLDVVAHLSTSGLVDKYGSSGGEP